LLNHVSKQDIERGISSMSAAKLVYELGQTGNPGTAQDGRGGTWGV